MAEPEQYFQSANLLRAIAEVIYGPAMQSHSVAVRDLYTALGQIDTVVIDSHLKNMERYELLSIDLSGSAIRPIGYGRLVFEKNCVAELVLGRDYIAKRYRDAIVHIIVEGRTKAETGGTGFFSADYPNVIITADHVLRQRNIKRIEDRARNEIPLKSGRKVLFGKFPDLAIIECEMPKDIEPIRIEWNGRELSPGADLMVFGYPEVALHFPELYQSKAELHEIAKKYIDPKFRESLIISSTTHPGCSGGPVIDSRGFAVGIIEQYNRSHSRTRANAFFSATPAYYLKEFL